MKNSFNKFISSVKNKNIVVWGLGLNQGGLEAAKYFAKIGSEVTVVDLKKSGELAKSIAELKKFSNIKFIFGKQEEAIFSGADLIIKNPAISWNLTLTKKLLKKGYQIETDVTLFFRYFQGKIIGVTGSKGKTTTTTLISQVLKKGKKDVLLGGNIRVSLFSFLKEKYLNNRKKIAVLELSSFQLEDLAFIKKSPDIAVVTNILRDHLNRYGSYEKYIEAKSNICRYQKEEDFLVLNMEDKRLKDFEKGSVSSVILSERSESKDLTRIIIENPILQSPNNLSNLAAALAVAKIFKIKKNIINQVIKGFKGVPYRMEKIATISKVIFYNDTAATIPDAAIGGINSLDPGSRRLRRLVRDDNKKNKIILISGGADKDLKFDNFAKTINRKVKNIILLPGSATPTIVKLLKKFAPKTPRIEVNSMDKAVKTAYKTAEPGDTVLLSPGCASFGLFENEFDRGDQFNEAVKRLSS